MVNNSECFGSTVGSGSVLRWLKNWYLNHYFVYWEFSFTTKCCSIYWICFSHLQTDQKSQNCDVIRVLIKVARVSTGKNQIRRFVDWWKMYNSIKISTVFFKIFPPKFTMWKTQNINDNKFSCFGNTNNKELQEQGRCFKVINCHCIFHIQIHT